MLASSQTYTKLSSNGLDLVELEPKPVDHRQIRIGPVQNRNSRTDFIQKNHPPPITQEPAIDRGFTEVRWARLGDIFGENLKALYGLLRGRVMAT